LSQSSSSHPTSATLLFRVRQGDAVAWQRFAKVYTPLVYSWARRAGLQASDASDIVQEVFRSVSTSLDQFRQDENRGGFRAWLWTITRNKIHDHFRAQAKRAEATGGTDANVRLQQLPEDRPLEDDSEGKLELNRLSHRALEQVKSEFEATTWQVFWRATIEGDAATDIAADLGVTKWAVYKAKTRVLHRLRQEFGDLLD
jgi:RNA polymerase sigma-70 factor (ECF subfamily)